MTNQIKRLRNEKGFTLIELLVVIVILGILAAVVVFAVGGLTDKGEGSSCKIDTRTLKTAQEAHFARTSSGSTYAANDQALVTAKLLGEVSSLHETTSVSPFSSYTIAVTDAKCGNTSSADANTDGVADNLVDPANPNNK